jgi:hypothetical protein
MISSYCRHNFLCQKSPLQQCNGNRKNQYVFLEANRPKEKPNVFFGTHHQLSKLKNCIRIGKSLITVNELELWSANPS